MTPMKRKLVEKLYPKHGDPFFGYPYREEDTDLKELFAWGSTHDIFYDTMEKTDAKLIVEYGTWLGGSAIHMAKRLKEKNIDGCVVCIDSFLACHLLHMHEPVQATLKTQYGRPEMWKSFYANVFYHGVEGYILPIHKPTRSGFRLLNGKNTYGFNFNAEFDMAYIDAAHIAPAVYCDAEEAWPLLKTGGTMIFDDVIPNQVTRPYEASDFTEVWSDLQKFAHDVGADIDLWAPKARIVKK
jgi:predicted O-methyltransferase YrrM